MITLVTAVLVLVVFLRTLVGSLRDRDPVQRDVTLILLPVLGMCVSGAIREVGHRPLPALVGVTVTALLLFQPYLTLRHTARLGHVPTWLDRALLLGTLISIVAVTAAPRPLDLGYLILIGGSFTVTEVVAGSFLLRGAVRRSGAARVRLQLAAAATYLFAVMIVLLISGAILYPGTTSWPARVARIVALISAIGYLGAFMPPAWLRRLLSATVWYEATEDLQRLPPTVSTAQVWRHFTQVVHQTTGTDAVVLIRAVPEPADGTTVEQVVAVCRPGSTLPGQPIDEMSVDELDRVLAARQPIDARSSRSVPALAAHYAEATGTRLITAMPLDLVGGGRGVVLFLDRYRALFSADDLRLAGLLGAQARLLAERGAVIESQRDLAEQLAASVAALTHASQAKSDFLAGMSHELRTPLNAIIGFSDLMRAEPAEGDRRVVPAEWVEHIHNSGRHLLNLINDILDLAKVEAGRMELNPEPVVLDKAISDVVTSLRPLTDRKHLQVRLEVPPVAVRADPLRFRQILDNLLSNAIKFTPEEGRITITAGQDGHDVALTVADSGIGIAPEDHGRVFEEFQQVGDAAQRKAGTGLGLALTRRLVEAHGGSIGLVSAIGEGSRFTVRLPDATAEAPPPQPAPPVEAEPEPAGAARGRVLIVDDDARAAELLTTYLSAAGYRVRIAQTGEEGLAAAREWRPDAILLDVILPGLDGWNVLRELKQEPGLCDIPVFFATIIDDRKAGLSLGAADFFVKPVDHDALLARLAEHIVPGTAEETASVLVVDRDDHTRRVVEERLRAGGIDVVTCDDGLEGLRLSRDRRFDLIICDLQMPDVDGFALLSGLEVDPATRGIPVLALTAPDLSDADRCRLTGKVIGTVPRVNAASDGLREWVDLAALGNTSSTTRGEVTPS